MFIFYKVSSKSEILKWGEEKIKEQDYFNPADFMVLAFGFTILRLELTILRYVRAALMLNNHMCYHMQNGRFILLDSFKK